MTAFQTYTNKQKRKHLLKLAEFLEQPHLEQRHKVRFDMGNWTNEVVPVNAKSPRVVNCGTSACMTGYATIALNIPRHLDKESWEEYCYRVLLPDTSIHQVWHSLEFRWLFDADWGIDSTAQEGEDEDKEKAPDNTPQGGAARIRYYLANGVPEYRRVYADMCDFDKEKYMEWIKPYHVDFRKSS